MQLARVCGQVISTKKAEKLMGFKILVCQPIDMVTFEEKGAPFVSIDSVGAGEGELVMCVAGSSSRQTTVTDAKPVDNAIVAIIDSVDILGERCFDKHDPDVKPAAAKKTVAKSSEKKSAKAAEVKPEAKKKEAKPEAKAEVKAEESAKAELKMTETKPKKSTKKAQPKPGEEKSAQEVLFKEEEVKSSEAKVAEEKIADEEVAKKIIEDIMKKLDEQEAKAKSTKKHKAEKPENK